MVTRWTPRVVVAAILERNNQFLLVEERQTRGLVLNTPSGHLEKGESLTQAVVREVLEETAYDFTPTALVGTYLSRYQGVDPESQQMRDLTFLRFVFCGELGKYYPERILDKPIERTVWMSLDGIKMSANRHRSPIVLRSINDFMTGSHFPLEKIFAHESIWHPYALDQR